MQRHVSPGGLAAAAVVSRVLGSSTNTWPSTKSRRGLGKMEKVSRVGLSFIRQFERRCDMANQLAGTQGRADDGGVRGCGRGRLIDILSTGRASENIPCECVWAGVALHHRVAGLGWCIRRRYSAATGWYGSCRTQRGSMCWFATEIASLPLG